MTISERYAEVRARIPDDVTLVVVTKTVAAELVREAIDAGAHDLGENRAQELAPKARALADTKPRWHFIGQLQRNKVRVVAPYVALWQSVDRDELATEIAARAPAAPVLVQVNVGGEAQKGGCTPESTEILVETCRNLGLRVEGLMTVPPIDDDPVPHFRTLRRLTDQLGLSTCSMGMSGDFVQAIAEGSTMVRIGSAVFGPRPAGPDARR